MSDSAAQSVFRILLVEDAPDQSLLLSAVLQKLGPFDVTLVQDGVQALELARRDGFDLVLTDLNLPGMDGFELTRELKAAFPKLPVLAATGYADPSYVEGAYRAGVDALMTKPVDPEDLEARLRELLPRWRSPDTRPPCVLAVGLRPGEVELGCAASLAAHKAAGHEVVVVLLADPHEDERALKRARKAAEHLGVRLMVPEMSSEEADLAGRGERLRAIVGELEPTWAYVPSGADRDPLRRDVHRMATAALEAVPTVLAYAGATTSLAFTPSVFRDVERWMDTKLGALAYHQSGHRDPSTSPDFALAQARYWGRFKDFGEVEPFELVDGGDAAPGPDDAAEAPDAGPDRATVAALEELGVTDPQEREPEVESTPEPDPEVESEPEEQPEDEPAEEWTPDPMPEWARTPAPTMDWASIPEPEPEPVPEPVVDFEPFGMPAVEDTILPTSGMEPESERGPEPEPEVAWAPEPEPEPEVAWAPEPEPEPEPEPTPAPRRAPPPPIMPGRMPGSPGLRGRDPGPGGSTDPSGTDA